MSHSTKLFECPVCHSSDITFDPTSRVVTCNRCGGMYIPAGFPEEDLMSYPSTAGTIPPEAVVETEELGYRKRRYLLRTHSHPEFDEFSKEINELQSSVKELQNKVEGLSIVSPKVVVVEEVPRQEAKRRVVEYFKEHGTADIEELMLNLKIRVQLLVDIIDELRKEGKISEEE